MLTENKTNKFHTPNFTTFPIFEEYEIVKASQVSIPSEEATIEAKEWVDFKEM